jgi:putative transcriptional regulator
MFKSLAPGFLIASPPLLDPNFDRTVVLLATHDEDGAFGFVVNRKAPLTVGELLNHAGYDGEHEDPAQVWIGGPVQPGSGWLLVDDPDFGDGDGEGIMEVGKYLRITSSRKAFDQLAREAAEGPILSSSRMILLGYSGWSASQLEGEIARGAWLPTPLDKSILFDVQPDDRWEAAFAMLGLTPTQVMSMNRVGQA